MVSTSGMGWCVYSFVISALVCFVSTPAGLAAGRSRLSAPMETPTTVSLPGTVRNFGPKTRDVGIVERDFVLPYVTMVLKPSRQQQVELERLLRLQQTRSSPHYHRWLTPEQYPIALEPQRTIFERSWIGCRRAVSQFLK
jgi:hypothetical protein